MKRLAPVVLVALGFLVGCGTEYGSVDRISQESETPLVDRRGTVIADGCALDGWQRAVLHAPSTKRVLKEVVLLCGTTRDAGNGGPADASARGALTELVTALRADGYAVKLGVSFTDETGQRYDGAQIAKHLGDAQWVASMQASIAEFAALADGIEIDIQRIGAGSRALVTAFVAGTSAKLRPASKTLGVFVPPSTTDPSDLPGGDAFDVGAIAPYVDRIRVMTLDYTEAGSGPTLDPGWAVDAIRLALKKAGTVPVDVSVPLYGTDFSSYGTRPISYVEAMGFAYVAKVPVQRGVTQAPHVDWRDGAGVQHYTWFDDRVSTIAALRAWDPSTMPPGVGVVYYGFGAEDPTLWDGIAKELP